MTFESIIQGLGEHTRRGFSGAGNILISKCIYDNSLSWTLWLVQFPEFLFCFTIINHYKNRLKTNNKNLHCSPASPASEFEIPILTLSYWSCLAPSCILCSKHTIVFNNFAIAVLLLFPNAHFLLPMYLHSSFKVWPSRKNSQNHLWALWPNIMHLLTPNSHFHLGRSDTVFFLVLLL